MRFIVLPLRPILRRASRTPVVYRIARGSNVRPAWGILLARVVSSFFFPLRVFRNLSMSRISAFLSRSPFVPYTLFSFLYLASLFLFFFLNREAPLSLSPLPEFCFKLRLNFYFIPVCQPISLLILLSRSNLQLYAFPSCPLPAHLTFRYFPEKLRQDT